MCSTVPPLLHRLTPPSHTPPPKQMNETALILATQQNAYGIVKSILRVALRKSIQQKDRVPTKNKTQLPNSRHLCLCCATYLCDVPFQKGNTALHYAASNGDFKSARALVIGGGDFDAVDKVPLVDCGGD